MLTQALLWLLNKCPSSALLTGLVIAAACGAMPSEAHAQSWTKICGVIKVIPDDAGEGAQPQEVNRCSTLQEQFDTKTGRLVVSAAVLTQDRQGQSLSVLMPLGVDLRKPVEARIDSGNPLKLEYVKCNQAGCTAEIQLTPELLKAMKDGQQLLVETKGPRGRPIRFNLALTGFGAADDGNPITANQYQEARQQLVGQIRARRAEQVKRAVQELDKKQAPQRPPAQPQQPPQPQQ
jgi:invasion protein IalB